MQVGGSATALSAVVRKRAYHNREAGPKKGYNIRLCLPFFVQFQLTLFCDHIKFQAGTHEKTISVSMDDFRKLARPRGLEFSYHVMS